MPRKTWYPLLPLVQLLKKLAVLCHWRLSLSVQEIHAQLLSINLEKTKFCDFFDQSKITIGLDNDCSSRYFYNWSRHALNFVMYSSQTGLSLKLIRFYNAQSLSCALNNCTANWNSPRPYTGGFDIFDIHTKEYSLLIRISPIRNLVTFIGGYTPA